MNQLQFTMMRVSDANDSIAHRIFTSYDERQKAAARYCRPFNEKTMREWLQCAVEPWRLYGARKPDDLPGRNGDKRALARLIADESLNLDL